MSTIALLQTEEERRATAERSGGTMLDLDEGDDEWAEEISIGGFHIGTSTFLVETMERYLKEVLDDYSTGSLAQIVSIPYCTPGLFQARALSHNGKQGHLPTQHHLSMLCSAKIYTSKTWLYRRYAGRS